MTTMKLIGMDGLSSDETVTRYYWDGKDLYVDLWGKKTQLAVYAAIINIKRNIAVYQKLLEKSIVSEFVQVDRQRLFACQKLLAELEKLPQ